MSIATGNRIKWSEFIASAKNAIATSCCNIGDISSLPTWVRNTDKIHVATGNSTWKWSAHDWSGDHRTTYYYKWNASGASGLITSVSSQTVESDWTNFLTAANINVHSDKLMSAQELSLAVGLFMQFLAYHKKPICIRGQIFGSSSTMTYYKYVNEGVALTPKYTLPGYPDSTATEIDNTKLQNILNQNFQANQLMKCYEDIKPYKSTITGGGRI